jgi:tetratricopeptide (TPR) repeat protein
MGRKEQIISFLQSAPEDEFLNYALATEYIAEGNTVEAEAIFQKLIHDHPHYVPTYYHLGKLLERKFDNKSAISIYRLGIEAAKRAKDNHALSELQSALLELEYGD